MLIDKKTGYLHFILIAILAIFIIPFNGCGGGGGGSSPSGSSGSTTTTTTTTTSSYNPSDLPEPTSFSLDEIEVDLDPTTITFGSISITGGAGATADNTGTIATITASGTYNIFGTSADGQVKVDVDTTTDTGDVILVLNGVNITSLTKSPIDIESAERVIIVLADGTDNYLTDGTTNTSVDEDGEAIAAALFSKDDLVICGTGSLTVKANYWDGIQSKDGLIIDGGTISVNSVDDGIIGKNHLSVESGNIIVSAGGDGLKSTNEGDITQGYIFVQAGDIDIDAGADAIQAETHIMVTGGEFILTTAGGSSNTAFNEDLYTAKGLKANVGITVEGGYFDIDSADDAINSDDTIVISGGDLYLASGDDAIHSELALTVEGGYIDVSTCYEGIESLVITINNGEIHVLSDDDPINASNGSRAETQPGVYLYINGGYMYFECENADGFDSNGAVVIKGGTIIINGPESGANGILDYASFTMSGGFLVGAGTSNMALPAGGSNSQNALMIYFTIQEPAGTLLHIETSDGTKEVVTFEPAVKYQAIEISSSLLTIGAAYNIYLGGSDVDGTDTHGLGGTYNNNGTLYATFTMNSTVQNVGTGGRGGGF